MSFGPNTLSQKCPWAILKMILPMMRFELAQIFVPLLHEKEIKKLDVLPTELLGKFYRKEEFYEIWSKMTYHCILRRFSPRGEKDVKQQLKSRNFHRFGLIRDLGLIQYAFLMKSIDMFEFQSDSLWFAEVRCFGAWVCNFRAKFKESNLQVYLVLVY